MGWHIRFGNKDRQECQLRRQAYRTANISSELIEGVSNHTLSPSIAEELKPITNKIVLHDFVELVNKTHMSSKKVRNLVKEYRKQSQSDIYDCTEIKDKIIDMTARCNTHLINQ